ncbi:TetR/AcrR family transcriptional regulator [Halothermothrix orenii]|uniref:Transcriptional regulator, TetR family n=1 Tax=Halothermothrix orenii (strain H 168 / OCM 544 / DSM 9562) TaxID=373903 RepID=B8CZQ2_HALOH|nr:TetR/AcrR family transcriptional regulator [Halothermothrix orenii]ACL70754.1 transcriptional regulator, TetR family [Halothermothrix orenii H 168]
MGKERQQQKHQEIKQKILEVARGIIANEGIEGLSIRKITRSMDYSPAIIYHYFKDKDEIIQVLLSKGYKNIINSVKSVIQNEGRPEKEIKDAFTCYIKAALDSPDIYKTFMLSSNEDIIKKTAILGRGISEDSLALKMLVDNIKKGISEGYFKEWDPELTAQVIWTATFGLIIKLIVEKDISEDQVNRLIEHHFNLIFSGLLKEE